MGEKFLLLVVCLTIVGCATSVPLPQNVSLNSNNYIDRINFDYFTQQNDIDAFKMAKVCIAENITNEEVFLKDSSKSFVGSYTGHYYNISSKTQIDGSSVIRMVEDDLKTIIARGMHEYSVTVCLLPLAQYLRYTVKMVFNQKILKIQFTKIERAQKNTGYLSNSGFDPVGNWPGARPEEVYTQLEMLSESLWSCVK